MTKKETAELERLRDEVLISRALRFTEPVERDVLPPQGRNAPLVTGFDCNAYNDRVDPGCSSSGLHGSGQNTRTTSQGSRALFSTKLLALRALRHEVERDCAKRLAEIDKRITIELLTTFYSKD